MSLFIKIQSFFIFTTIFLISCTISVHHDTNPHNPPLPTTTKSCIDIERQALLALRDWGSEQKMDCCKWGGVSCNNHGNVIRLRLSGINVTGNIPRHLSNLTKLYQLDQSNNTLTGSIPDCLGDMTSLRYLDLSFNQLGGPIPKSFGNYSSLIELHLQSNLLNGSVPNFVGCSSMEILSLGSNNLHGGVPNFTGCQSLKTIGFGSNRIKGKLSDFTSQLPNIQILSLYDNLLDGNIPDLTGCKFLVWLDLHKNQLSGNLPTSTGQLANLLYLDLSQNVLKGVITDVHFQNLTQLSYLSLSHNSLAIELSSSIPFQLFEILLRSCKLGPSFPLWLKTQTTYMTLDISNAGISDNVPAWFWELSPELEYLNISTNEIKGTIPRDMWLNVNRHLAMDLSYNRFEGRVPLLPFNLSVVNLSGNRFSGNLSFLCDHIYDMFTLIEISNNSFSGSLPDCWSKFKKNLVILSLSNNNFSGHIPSSLGSLSHLEALNLGSNGFVGKLPMSLSNCKSLRFLDLGHNNLSGIIPRWIGEKLPALTVVVLHSNAFYGRLPSQLCWLDNLQLLDISSNGLEGDIPECFGYFKAMATKSRFRNQTTNHFYAFHDEIIPGGIRYPEQDGVAEYIDTTCVFISYCNRSIQTNT